MADAVLDVGHPRRLHRAELLEPLVVRLDPLEEPLPSPEQHWDDRQNDFVYQFGSEVLEGPEATSSVARRIDPP